MVKDINSVAAVLPGRLLPLATPSKATDGTNGTELWKSDGTASGTVMVKDINSGGSSDPDELAFVGNTLYFQADDGTNGVELWKSERNLLRLMVKDIDNGIYGIVLATSPPLETPSTQPANPRQRNRIVEERWKRLRCDGQGHRQRLAVHPGTS